MAKNSSLDLLTISNRVEVPFICAKIADMSLGMFESTTFKSKDKYNFQYINITYPNFVKSLTIKKNANGVVNEYTLQLVYAVTEKDDPNLIEKLLSKAKKDRKILFSYGDYNVPNFIFREEQAIITEVTNSLSLDAHTITYVIKAVSNSYVATAGKYNFATLNIKGSDLIKRLIFSTEYQLTSLFYGMKTLKQIQQAGFIADDDTAVTIEAKNNISILDYLKYIVSCMRWKQDTSTYKTSIYKIAVYDDILSEYGGPYFKVVRYNTSDEVLDSDDLDYLNVDIGYPDKNTVISFTVTDDTSFSILYDYNEELSQAQYQYRIKNDGTIDYSKYDRVMRDSLLMKVTEAERTWWAKMTSYPINAKLVLRGLIKNIQLMSLLRINVLFYGKKYIYSGIYAINGQTDVIDGSGYKTILTLIRVGGISL